MTTEAEDFVAPEDSGSEVSNSEKEDSVLTLFLDILRLPEISSSMHGTLTNLSAIQSKLSSFLSSHNESSTNLPPEPPAVAAGEMKTEPLRMTAAAFYIPKERETGGEVDRLGEDAFFVCEEKQVVGVADGVGSWKKVGVDAGAYARELMSKAEEAARLEEETYVDPFAVLEVAHKGTTDDGSSTACIVALHDKIVSCANIGDSGYLVVRDGAPLHHSPVMQQGFNTPYQLHKTYWDPSRAMPSVTTVDVKPGDVVVVGTDGLFDNLLDREIAYVIMCGFDLGLDANRMATILAKLAYRMSSLCRRETPFSIGRRYAEGNPHCRGKRDDITVVLMCIVE